MPPRRLSSLLKQDTLVALLDGTSAAASSQTVPVEKAVMVPASVKKFRHLIAHPKLVDKIMMVLDPLRFFQSELNDPLWKVETKLSICISRKHQNLSCLQCMSRSLRTKRPFLRR